MIITYRDDLGLVSVEVDEYGISFGQSFDGGTIAMFSSGETDYEIFAFQIVRISGGK